MEEFPSTVELQSSGLPEMWSHPCSFSCRGCAGLTAARLSGQRSAKRVYMIRPLSAAELFTVWAAFTGVHPSQVTIDLILFSSLHHAHLISSNTLTLEDTSATFN